MEVAAAAVAAEQVVSTTVEAGIVYGVAKPTPALNITFSRISSQGYLPRVHHSLTIVNGQVYIFGGEDESGKLAGDEVHIVSLPLKAAKNEGKPDYKCVPSFNEVEGGPIPGARAGHTAVAIGHRIYVFGGRQEEEKPIQENGRIWVFDTTKLSWTHIDPVTGHSCAPARYLHGCVATAYPPPPSKSMETSTYTEQITSTISKLPSLVTGAASSEIIDEPHGTIFMQGGLSGSTSILADAWTFNVQTRIWTALPSIPSPTPYLPSFAIANETLYLISSTSDFSNDIHSLPLERKAHTEEDTSLPQANLVAAQGAWTVTSIPSNPLTPGPKARKGAALTSVTTGAGREYLLYLMGEKADATISLISGSHSSKTNDETHIKSDITSNSHDVPVFFSDAWAYGLPAASSFTPAGLKDVTRSTLGLPTAPASWSEVKIEANIETPAATDIVGSGKSHPGPRAWFAADAVGRDIDSGRGVVIWGGKNGRGEVEGDGWLVSVA